MAYQSSPASYGDDKGRSAFRGKLCQAAGRDSSTYLKVRLRIPALLFALSIENPFGPKKNHEKMFHKPDQNAALCGKVAFWIENCLKIILAFLWALFNNCLKLIF